MSFSVGIVGLPNVGKSTLFKVLTKREVKISPKPFTTIEPNTGKVSIKDSKLDEIAHYIKPQKITYTSIDFIDIAGLVKGAHLGEGLGNQFLSHTRRCDEILFVLRAFEKEEVENVLGEINPKKELDILKFELLMKDLETIEKALPKRSQGKNEGIKINVLKKIKEKILEEKMINEIYLTEEEKRAIKEYQFLTQKPYVCIVNTDNKTNFERLNIPYLEINLKEEEEMMELSGEEQKELQFESKIEKLINMCYKNLNLITFYTIAGGKEVRAWTIKENSSIIEAASLIHSDFSKRFIRAEVINFQDFQKVNDWKVAKDKGLINIVGKDYKVKDRDIIEIRI